MTNYDPDNPKQDLVHRCPDYARKHLNPIIDWTTDEVWEFIHEYNVPYCCLYDNGYKRLGCIGCPMGSIEQREREFESYPKYKQAYIRAFDRMIDIRMGGVQTNYINRGRTTRKIYQNPIKTGTQLYEAWITETIGLYWK